MRKPAALIVLVTCLVLLGVGAIAGGGALCVSPGGELLGIPLSLLDSTPFRDYLIPGLILFFANGVFPMLVAYALLRKPDWKALEAANPLGDHHWSWTALVLSGVLLVLWIVAEMVLLRISIWIHWLYLFWGLAIVALSLLTSVREYCAVNPVTAPTSGDGSARSDT